MRSLHLLSRRATEGRQRKKRRFKIGLFLVFICVCIIGIFAGVHYGTFFKITNIDISGLPASVSIEETHAYLIHTFGDTLRARILGMNNILSWPRRAVLRPKEIPLLAEIALKREFFSRRLMVDVVARKRFGIWCFEHERDTSCFWFDGRDGLLLEHTSVPDGKIIHTLFEEVAIDTSYALGASVVSSGEIERLKTILLFFKEKELFVKRAVFDRQLQEVSLTLFSGPIVRMSLRFNPDTALTACNAFLSSRDMTKIHTIDLTVENKLYWTPL